MTANLAGPSGSNRSVDVQDKTLLLDGRRFRYREWGNPDAPPLVLLYAYLSHARGWDTVAAALSDRFRVLALDQRGHGESEWAANYHELRVVADLCCFIDALGLETVSLVGFSICGYAACSYALLYPERVRRLSICECFVEDPFEGDAPAEVTEHISAVRALPAEFTGSADDVAAAAAAAYRPLAPHAGEQELRHWILGGLNQTSPGRWTWRSDPVLRVPGESARLNPAAAVMRARLSAVQTPTLMIVGAESFHRESAERIAATDKTKTLVRIEQAGHWVPLDNPDGFLEVVNRFLAAA